ncbi:MAG: hypothetical protein HOW73_43380 [Polyangiaceae bacterium]|nr:hypothetical protein [Polyangiaceae bacterium]
MTLRVHTARIGSRQARASDDVLDITRKSGKDLGIVFAPSWTILNPALYVRNRAAEIRARDPEHAREMEERSWRTYRDAYGNEMRESYRAHRARWDELLARESVTLVCYCPDLRCHRTLLGQLILPKLGAIYVGEKA